LPITLRSLLLYGHILMCVGKQMGHVGIQGTPNGTLFCPGWDTKTQTGLAVQAYLVTETYEKGVKVPDEEMDALNIEFHDVCPQWNYTIHPRSTLRPA
jgi:hypothetical protein